MDELLPRLVGLEAVPRARLVRQEPKRDLPVVLLTGQHGTGKTAALDAAEENYRGLVPFARVDLAALGAPQQEAGPEPYTQLPNTSGVVEVLERIAVGLSAAVPGYQPCRFPRLLPGLFAVTSWRRAQQAQRVLAIERIGRLLPLAVGGAERDGEGWVTAIADQLADAGGDEDVETVATLVVEAYMQQHSTAAKRAETNAWYRARPQAPDTEQIDPLVRLCLDFHQGGDLLPPVEQTLVAALLEDLADGYTGWWRRVNRVPRPLALLDDAHTEAGRAFLERLLEERRIAAQAGTADPLVVLATHLGDAADRYPSAQCRQLADLAQPLQWQRRSSDRRSAGVLRVPLPPFTADDLLTLLQRTATPGHAQLRTVVYRLTGGHPLGGSVLCDVAVEAAEERPVTPEGLLDLPTEDGLPVGEHLVRRLLPALPTRHHLMVLSLARDREAAEALAGEGLTGEALQGHAGVVDAERARVVEAERYLEREEWTVPRGHPFVPAPSFVSDPLLYTLLVHETRRASPSEEPGRQWGDLHAFLRDFHTRRGAPGDEAEALRHSLALGDAPRVCELLAEWFTEREDAPAFLAAVQHVATAPHPPLAEWRDERTETARGELDHRYAAAGDVQRSINRLLHGLWYLGDPLRAPLREVCTDLGTELDFLSLRHASGRYVLNAAARSWPTAAWEGRRPYPVEGLD